MNFCYKPLYKIPEDIIRGFLSTLTSETVKWREFFVDKDGSRYLPVTVSGYAVFDNEKMIALGYFYKLDGHSKAYGVPVANVGMVIKKEYQGKGIGQKLHELLEIWAQKDGIKRFFATQDGDNEVALHNVLKRGWKLTKTENVVEKELK